MSVGIEFKRGWSEGSAGDVYRSEGRLQLEFFYSTRENEREEKVCSQPTWFSPQFPFLMSYFFKDPN